MTETVNRVEAWSRTAQMVATKARFFGLDGFLLSLLAAVALAWIAPDPGRTGGPLHAEYAAGYGISLIFFLYGLRLSPEKMRAGVTQWRLHLAVQVATYLLFPALVLTALLLAGDAVPPDLRLGFFYLAALPSTVTSSVVMTSIAEGNVPGAIFNASLSSLIGVFATPLWMAWFMSTHGQPMPLGAVILKIVLLLLVPVVLGQLARPKLTGWLNRHGWLPKLFDRAVIVIIVYNAFCDSVRAGVWVHNGLAMVATVLAADFCLFAVMFAVTWSASRAGGFDRGDTIACVFCGSKKSLATGVPLARVIFGAGTPLGLILAPIMIYHLMQLIIISIIAGRWRHRSQVAAAVAAR